MKPNDESFHGPPIQNGHRRDYSSVEPYTPSQIRVITLRRRGNVPLGFSIRGGWEHGTGIFVSEVQTGSIAHRQGLRVGDQIVRINGFSIHRAIHMEVLSLLKTCPGVVLKVKRVGILPIKEKKRDPVTWKVVEQNHSIPYSHQGGTSRTNGFVAENCIIVKIEFTVSGSSSLGCSIAKGPPEMPGIFMCTVKEGGVADQAGLEVGDQIMDMSGTSFMDIKLPEAVALMKSAKDIRLTVKKGAGLCLFSDHNSSNEHHLINNDLPSRILNDSIPSSQRQSVGLTEHDFSGSNSSKSEDSSFQSSVSSDSEKDYSVSEECSIRGIKTRPTVNGWHKKTGSHGSNESSCSSGRGASIREDSWIAEERRKLEEEQKRLAEEKQRLEEEKRRLELEKRACCITPQEDTASTKGSFLDELQKAAAKMNIKDDKADIDQVLQERRFVGAGKLEGLKLGENVRCKGQEDILKRKQHELLMEEFREAHKKMFGQQNGGSLSNKAATLKETGRSHIVVNTAISQASTKSSTVKGKPPAPPIPPEARSNGLSSKPKTHFTVNGQLPSLHSQTLPRPERILPSRAKTSVDDLEEMRNKSPCPPMNFRVTFDLKTPNGVTNSNGTQIYGKSNATDITTEDKIELNHNPLVEVTPWTTRL